MAKQAPKKSASLFYECISFDNDMQNTTFSEDFGSERTEAKHSSLYVKVVLATLSFFTLNGARPGIFIAPHLLNHGWREKDIGLVLFIGGITTLIVQTPIGMLIDISHNKRIFILGANLLIGLTSIALVYNSELVFVIVSLCIQVLLFISYDEYTKVLIRIFSFYIFKLFSYFL